MFAEPHPLETRPPGTSERSRKGMGWWPVGGCAFACLMAAVLWAFPYYRKAMLIREIRREHGTAISAGAAPPIWTHSVLKWLGEPQAHQIVEVVYDRLMLVRLDGASIESTTTGSTRILIELARHHHIQRLELMNMQLTPELVQALRGLAKLEELSLSGCSIATADWELLTKFTALERLDLANCKFGDDEVGLLSRLTNLQSLNLSGTQVTDAAIPELKKLKTLRQLDFSQTPVSEAACRELVASVPGLDISDD